MQISADHFMGFGAGIGDMTRSLLDHWKAIRDHCVSRVFVQVFTASPLDRVDLIRSGQVVDSIPVDGLLEVTLQRPVENLTSGEYIYVRAVQEDMGAAWSSPIFVE